VTDDDSTDRPTLQTVDEWADGFSWIAYPDERGQRASHALKTEAGVWVVDPVDAAGLDDHLTDLGAVAGVVVIQDRHTRDAVAVADRHDVPVYVPDWMELAREKLGTTAEPLDSELPGTDYAVHELIATDEWEEAILVDETRDILVVPEAVGTLDAFEGSDGSLGVHPALDDPPASLSEWRPEHVLVGHGHSVHGDADAALSALFES
jgi:hypothetical protein